MSKSNIKNLFTTKTFFNSNTDQEIFFLNNLNHFLSNSEIKLLMDDANNETFLVVDKIQKEQPIPQKQSINNRLNSIKYFINKKDIKIVEEVNYKNLICKIQRIGTSICTLSLLSNGQAKFFDIIENDSKIMNYFLNNSKDFNIHSDGYNHTAIYKKNVDENFICNLL